MPDLSLVSPGVRRDLDHYVRVLAATYRNVDPDDICREIVAAAVQSYLCEISREGFRLLPDWYLRGERRHGHLGATSAGTCRVVNRN